MKHIVLFFFTSTVLFSTTAQTYELNVLNEPYVPLEEAISITQGEVWDDPTATIPIGFDVPFFSTSISELNLDLVGSALVSGDVYAAELFSVILPFQADVIDRGYNEEASQSEILYSTSGEVGDRVFTVEWDNAGFYGELFSKEPSNNSFINFQFQLYEATGVIRFHYGSSSIIDPEIAYEGDLGPLVGMIFELEYDMYDSEISLILDGDPTDPTVVNESGYYDYVTLDDTPMDGTVYEFQPIPTALSDLGGLSFEMYPNPTIDKLRFKEAINGTRPSYAIYDLKGSLLMTGQLVNGVIDVSQLEVGVYHITIENEGGVGNSTFIKTLP